MNESSKEYILSCFDGIKCTLNNIEANCEEKEGTYAYSLYNDINRILYEIDNIVDVIQNTESDLDITDLRNELLKHGDLYRGFLASIQSAIDECTVNVDSKKVSEHVLDRIIGDE